MRSIFRFIKTMWREICVVIVFSAVFITIMAGPKPRTIYEKAHTAIIVDIDTSKVVVKVKEVYKIWQDGGEVLFYTTYDSSVKRYWFGSKNIRIDW